MLNRARVWSLALCGLAAVPGCGHAPSVLEPAEVRASVTPVLEFGSDDTGSAPAPVSWQEGGFLGLTEDQHNLTEIVSGLLGDRAPTDDEWRQLLTRTRIFRARTKWPAGVPYSVSMRAPLWMYSHSITAVPDVEGWESARAGTPDTSCGNAYYWDIRAAHEQVLGSLSATRRIEFGISVKGRQDSWHKGDEVSWTGTIEGDVEIVPTIDDAVQPVDSEELRTAVRESITAAPYQYKDYRSLTIYFDLDARAHPQLWTTALSLDLELLHRGEVVDTGRLDVDFEDEGAQSWHSAYSGLYRLYESTSFTNVPDEVLDDPEQHDDWALRVRGTSEGVLQLSHAATRWGGEVTIPLPEAVARERERQAKKEE